MAKVSCSIRFEPEKLEYILGADEYRALSEEVINDDALDDHGPTRHVLVIVDGYHVRAALRRHYGHDEPDLLADWLNRLGAWLADQYMTDEYGIELYVRAWDAHLPDEEESKKAFQALPEERRVRYASGRGHRYRGQRTVWLTADWHFTDLRPVGDRYVQSGVDARVAADIIGMALEKPHALFLVTGDQDFERAIQVVSASKEMTAVGLLTMQPRNGSKRLLANDAVERWLAYPEHVGPGFAKQL